MTLDDLLQLLLIAADDSGRVFRHHDLAEWPEGGLELFTQLGVLRRGSGGLVVECTNCTEPHLERVIVLDGDGEPSRMFISCPEAMRVEVTPEMCECWEVDPSGLARSIALTLKLKVSHQETVPLRLWRLGRVDHGGKTREVLLVLGLHLPDAGSIVRQVGPKGRSVVIVPSVVPDDRIWPGVVPAVIALDQIASIEDGNLGINGQVFMDMITESDTYKDDRSLIPHDPKSADKLLDRKIAKVIDSNQTKDVFVAAYVEFGSYRKAAAGLTERIGKPITKGKIERAVSDAGGIQEVYRLVDSASVSRGVPSNPQDRRKKLKEYGR